MLLEQTRHCFLLGILFLLIMPACNSTPEGASTSVELLVNGERGDDGKISIMLGESVVLSWSITNPPSTPRCELFEDSEFGDGDVDKSINIQGKCEGNYEDTPSKDTIYTFRAKAKGGGIALSKVEIRVQQDTEPPQVSPKSSLTFTVNGSTEISINEGETVTLAWDLVNPPDDPSCTLLETQEGAVEHESDTDIACSGNLELTPSISTIYAVVGKALPEGSVRAEVSVEVNKNTSPAEPNPTPDSPINFEQELSATDGAAFNSFGGSVSVDGDTLVIAAVGDNDNGTRSGSAYIFMRTSGKWNQQAKLTASDGAAQDLFGSSVAVSGTTAIISARANSEKGFKAGAAYVFNRAGSTWSEQTKLTASDGAAGAEFGSSVAIDANLIVVGAWLDDTRGDNAGAAYVFEKIDGQWTEQVKLTAADGAAGDQFGLGIAISQGVIVIAARADDEKGDGAGAAYIFEKVEGIWEQQSKLTASDGAADNAFGSDVSISNDTILVGARLDDDNGDDSGSAYIFKRISGEWKEQVKLTASDGAVDDEFGAAVALHNGIAVIGVQEDDVRGARSGSAYIYEETTVGWNELVKLTAPDGAAGDTFGSSVAVYDGSIVIGARGSDEKGEGSGSSYIFR